LTKGRFFGEHAFIRIGDVVMVALLIPPDIRFRRGPPPTRPANSARRVRPASTDPRGLRWQSGAMCPAPISLHGMLNMTLRGFFYRAFGGGAENETQHFFCGDSCCGRACVLPCGTDFPGAAVEGGMSAAGRSRRWESFNKGPRRLREGVVWSRCWLAGGYPSEAEGDERVGKRRVLRGSACFSSLALIHQRR